MSNRDELKPEFTHRFLPSKGNPTTLLLLHGTGGDENDLIPLGGQISSRSAMLSPRGRVSEDGMPRFFRRISEGVFDEADLKYRTQELALFLKASSLRYGFEPNLVVAVGYSNGANIAASMLLLAPDTLQGAVLFRPMPPFTPERSPNLSGKKIYISAGRADPIIPRSQTDRLATLLRDGGANIQLHWGEGGHSLTEEEVERAQQWFSKNFET